MSSRTSSKSSSFEPVRSEKQNCHSKYPSYNTCGACLSTDRTPHDGDQPDSFCQIIKKFCATVSLAIGHALETLRLAKGFIEIASSASSRPVSTLLFKPAHVHPVRP